jgi:hypothetical protein
MTLKDENKSEVKMRLRVRKEYAWRSGGFTPTNEVRYVYDGILVIQERNASNIPLATYTRGMDLSSSRQGAGGIGGPGVCRRGTGCPGGGACGMGSGADSRTAISEL